MFIKIFYHLFHHLRITCIFDRFFFFLTQNYAGIMNKWYVYLWSLLKSKLKKSATQWPMPKSKKQIFDDEKIPKGYKIQTYWFLWHYCDYSAQTVVLKKIGSKLTLRRFTTPWFISEFILSSMGHNGTMSQH